MTRQQAHGDVRRKDGQMTIVRIFEGLDALTARGAPAQDAARQGFLEWVFALDADRSAAEAARDALLRLAPAPAASPAAAAFLGYLDEAARTTPSRPVRRGGRRRFLH